MENMIPDAEMRDMGEVSDGYHTFNELYDHRAALFAALCRLRLVASWKSKLHHDGTMFDNYFIVGMDTPDGQISYHFHLDKWDMFAGVDEIPRASEWDGHTPNDTVKRLGSIVK